MSTVSYTATPNNVNPAATQALFPEWLLNPIGSEYAAQFGYDETYQLGLAIKNQIIESIPQQWAALKLFLGKTPEYHADIEYHWFEELWQRPTLTVSVGAGGGATVTVTLTAGGTSHVSLNDYITLPDNTKATVSAINTVANTITLAAANGAPALPAIGATDRLTITAAPIADGQNFFGRYDRSTQVKYSNWMAHGQRNKRWTTMTAQRYKNTGTTNYYERDMKHLMDECYRDLFALYINGTRGEHNIVVPADGALTAGTYRTRVGDGLFPFMQKYGAMNSISSPATLEEDFKALAFATNHEAVGGVRWILGTDRALHYMSHAWKDPVRYAPQDTVSSLDLMEYKFGTMRFVPIVVPQFEEGTGMFPSSFANRLIIINPDKIAPTCMTGYEIIYANNTGNMYKKNGGYLDYIDYFVEYMVGFQMTGVAGSFWVDLINI